MSILINNQNLTQVITNAGLTPSQNLIDKIVDINRKLENKISVLVNSSKFKKFKLTVVLEIAYRLITKGEPSSAPINRERLFSATNVISTTGVNSKEFTVPHNYRQFLSICQNVLNISDLNEADLENSSNATANKPSPLEILNMRYDANLSLLGEMKERCSEYLNNYKELFYNSLPESRKKDFDFSKPVYDCACFFVITQENKIPVERDFILDIAECDNRMFQFTVDQIKQARQIFLSKNQGIKRNYTISRSSVSPAAPSSTGSKLSRLDSLLASSNKKRNPIESNRMINSINKDNTKIIEEEIIISKNSPEKEEDSSNLASELDSKLEEEKRLKKENYLKWKQSKLNSVKKKSDDED